MLFNYILQKKYYLWSRLVIEINKTEITKAIVWLVGPVKKLKFVWWFGINWPFNCFVCPLKYLCIGVCRKTHTMLLQYLVINPRFIPHTSRSHTCLVPWEHWHTTHTVAPSHLWLYLCVSNHLLALGTGVRAGREEGCSGSGCWVREEKGWNLILSFTPFPAAYPCRPFR